METTMLGGWLIVGMICIFLGIVLLLVSTLIKKTSKDAIIILRLNGLASILFGIAFMIKGIWNP